jgi:hypothetical protein
MNSCSSYGLNFDFFEMIAVLLHKIVVFIA